MKKTGIILLLLGILGAPLPGRAGECKVALLFEGKEAERSAPFAELLAAVLGQKQGVEVVAREFAPGPATPEKAASMGKTAGAEVVVLGSLAPPTYRLEAQWVEAQSGAVLSAAEVAGTQGEVFDLVDALGRKLVEQLDARGTNAPRVMILEFANAASAEYGPFVRGLPDLLAASLGQAGGLNLVDRAQVREGMAHVALDPGNRPAPEEVAALGEWLGADWVVMGRFAEEVAVKARLVEVKSGKVLVERGGQGAGAELGELAAELGTGLAQQLEEFRRALHQVAVLGFENHAAGEYEGFVRGISDMLMTSLGQAEGLLVIERVQIERAMQNFALELSGPIDNEKAVEIGQWLGADAVVLGGFTRFGEVFRIDARLISARTGELLVAQNARGPEAEVMSMVDQLGSRLVASLAERQTEVQGGTGQLQVRFMITKTEMGERYVYHQLCKLYVDGKYLGTSRVVEKPEQWTTVFDKKLRAGKHEVEVVHGFVKRGAWDGELPEQPKVFRVVVEPGQVAALQYSFEVGWFDDRYLYEHPWRGLPR
jgi:TolB-like protein